MIANPKGCVELEDIAALAEGRLSGAERERVVGHVAGCEECREVLAGVVGVLTNAAASDGLNSAVGRLGPGRRSPKWTAALAATVLVVGGVVVYQRFATPKAPDRGAWLASMPPAEQIVDDLWGGIVMRGREGTSDLARQSAELGALLVDLEVSAAASEEKQSAGVLRRMASLLEAAGLLDREAAQLRSLADQHELEVTPTVDDELAQVDRAIRHRFLAFYLDLGSFAEEARLAALAQHKPFFDDRKTRRYISWLLTQRDEALSPSVEDRLRALQRETATSQERARAASSLLDEIAR